MGDLREGIEIGQAIRPDHILRSINALSGVTSNDLVIKGSLSVVGPLSITGSTSISENLSIESAITASKLLITEDNAKIGSSFIVKDDVVSLQNIIINKNINVKENVLISGSITLKELPEKNNNTTFLSIDEETGIIHKTTGSLREKITPVDIHYKFNENVLEDEYTFRGVINDLNVYTTKLIDTFKFASKLDISPTWIEHKSLPELQHWVNSNIMGDRLNGNIFWIKIMVTYKPHENGKSEIVLRYTNS